MTVALPRFRLFAVAHRTVTPLRAVILMSAVCWCFLATAHAATIIHAGRLIDGRSDEAALQMSIVIEEGRITSVVRGYLDPKEGDTLVKLTEHTVMPGLMDMHTHLQSQHSKDSYTERFFMEIGRAHV